MNYKDLRAALSRVRQQMPPQRNTDPLGIFNLVPRSFAGMRVYERPPMPPKIQVRQVYLSDGTPLLREQFLSEENAWWAVQYGFQSDPFANKALILGDWGMVVSKQFLSAIAHDFGA